MLHITQAIIVEGKYDKIKLDKITDALIVSVGGFNVFKNTETVEFLRKLAVERGIIIFTDADSAGFKIRTFIENSVTEGEVFHAYPPAEKGKEKRKETAGKEGLLGVEGNTVSSIEKALINAVPIEKSEGEFNRKDDFKTAVCELFGSDAAEKITFPVTKALLFELGLTGEEKSAEKRRELCKKMGLPPRMNANRLIDYLK